MKNIRFLIIVLVLFVPVFARADIRFDFSLVIDENGNISAYDSGNIHGDPTDAYDEFFDYSDGVLTINEDAKIYYIQTDIDLIITSNDKPVYVYYVEPNTPSKELSITFRNFYDVNDYRGSGTSSGLLVQGNDKSVRFIDSHIVYGSINMYDGEGSSDGRDRIIIENSTFDSGYMRSYYGITINNSTINLNEIVDSGTGNISIFDSNITVGGMILDYVPEFEFNIKNSNLSCSIDSCYVGSYYGGRTGVLVIEDSHIDGYTIENYGYTYDNTSYTKIINTELSNVPMIRSNNPLYLIDLDITVPKIEDIGTTSSNPNNGINIINTTLHSDDVKAMGYYNIENSYVVAPYLQFSTYPVNTSFTIRDSYIRLNSDSQPNIFNAHSFIIHNSNFLAETNAAYSYLSNRTLSEWLGASIEIDDDLKLVDKDNNDIYLLGLGVVDPSINKNSTYTLAYDADNYAKSLKLISKANITFKVENGTWADGTNSDIQITKDVWTKLSSDEIPVGMIGDTEGSWEIKPNTEDYAKGNITYVYKFKKKGIVKGVIEELTENPKTGVFRYSFITLLLLCISILVYRRLTINRYFKYK